MAVAVDQLVSVEIFEVTSDLLFAAAAVAAPFFGSWK
jgi:hypothetical protein